MFVNPFAGEFNIQLFFELLQIDGYNPLVVQPATYFVEHTESLLQLVPEERRDEATSILSKPFSFGALAMAVENWDLHSKDAFLAEISRYAQMEPNAVLEEGYWSDHWTYLLDLLENELAIFPEREFGLLFGIPRFRWIESQATVKPQAQRYHLTPAGLRQYNCIAFRETHKKWATTEGGDLARSNLAEKLLLLCTIKFATLDFSGAAVEMEGGKPGWYDAMNGLPGLLGSSVAEGCELLRTIGYLCNAVAKYQTDLEVYEEIAKLLKSIVELEKKRISSFERWLGRNKLRDEYRASTDYGFSGKRVQIPHQVLCEMLQFLYSTLSGCIDAETIANDGICPTYFYYEGKDCYEDSNGVLPGMLEKKRLPLFLEGPTRWLRTNQDNLEQMIQKVQDSPLLDRELRMYKLNTTLQCVSYEVGRARAFPAGWLENESIWLHMEYKYLLAMLECGLYRPFFIALKETAVPFMNPKVYKRSTLENSSFLVSSANSNRNDYGRGYVARLSGSTAEFISIWNRMLFGAKPFQIDDNGLYFELEPAVPAYLLPENHPLTAMFLGHTEVTYVTDGLQQLIPGEYHIRGYNIQGNFIPGPRISNPIAKEIRNGRIPKISVIFEAPIT